MKKLLFGLLLVIGFGCKDDNSTILDNTIWSCYSKYEGYEYIEFSTNGKVTYYCGTENGTLIGNMYYGKYVVLNNNITFTNLTTETTLSKYDWNSAAINGNTFIPNRDYYSYGVKYVETVKPTFKKK